MRKNFFCLAAALCNVCAAIFGDTNFYLLVALLFFFALFILCCVRFRLFITVRDKKKGHPRNSITKTASVLKFLV